MSLPTCFSYFYFLAWFTGWGWWGGHFSFCIASVQPMIRAQVLFRHFEPIRLPPSKCQLSCVWLRRTLKVAPSSQASFGFHFSQGSLGSPPHMCSFPVSQECWGGELILVLLWCSKFQCLPTKFLAGGYSS